MEESWLLSIVEISSKIATPLSLSGLGLSLFFSVCFYFIRKAKVGRITPSGLLKLLMRIFTLAFTLSLVALVLGVLAWLTSYFLGPMTMENKIQGLLLRKDYKAVISEAAPYVENNPRDDLVRHMLGTSYFVTGDFKSGKSLYEKMEKLYSDRDDCDSSRASAISSLAAFEAALGESESGLEYSSKLLKCEHITDAFMYNHMVLLALQNNNADISPPNNYKFTSSYFKSMASLLKFAFYLNKNGKHSNILNDMLRDAYCYDENIRRVIENRFESGDFSSSPTTGQEFRYETAAITNHLSLMERKALLKWLTSENCAV